MDSWDWGLLFLHRQNSTTRYFIYLERNSARVFPSVIITVPVSKAGKDIHVLNKTSNFCGHDIFFSPPRLSVVVCFPYLYCCCFCCWWCLFLLWFVFLIHVLKITFGWGGGGGGGGLIHSIGCLKGIQTHQISKECLFIMTQTHNLQIFKLNFRFVFFLSEMTFFFFFFLSGFTLFKVFQIWV